MLSRPLPSQLRSFTSGWCRRAPYNHRRQPTRLYCTLPPALLLAVQFSDLAVRDGSSYHTSNRALHSSCSIAMNSTHSTVAVDGWVFMAYCSCNSCVAVLLYEGQKGSHCNVAHSLYPVSFGDRPEWLASQARAGGGGGGGRGASPVVKRCRPKQKRVFVEHPYSSSTVVSVVVILGVFTSCGHEKVAVEGPKIRPLFAKKKSL